jgi:hypothetical protein
VAVAVAVVAAPVVAEVEEAWSGFSLSCLNLLKYRSEANSVMWRGSMMSYVWPLCHPVAGVSEVVIDKAYQERSLAHRPPCANGAERSEIGVALSVLKHPEVHEVKARGQRDSGHGGDVPLWMSVGVEEVKEKFGGLKEVR